MNKSRIGAQEIMDNMRKRVNRMGALNMGVSLSSMISNATLQTFIQPHDGVAIASVKVNGHKPSVAQITDSISNMFGGEMVAVASSLKILTQHDYATTVRAHLIRNVVTRPINDGATPSGFISLSKNIFLDEKDNATWKLVESDGGNRILVRDNSVESDGDMARSLMALASSGHMHSQEANALTASAESLMSSLNTGVLVSHVNKVGDVRMGFVVEPLNRDMQISMVTRGDSGDISLSHVSPTAIIEAYDVADYFEHLSLPQFEALSSGRDVNALVSYYKKVYGYNEDYLKKWLERVRSTAHLA